MGSPVALTVTQLRNVLQMPERPYEDPRVFDGTTYWELSHREVCSVLGVSGTASGASKQFIQDVDFSIISSILSWKMPLGTKPDINTKFLIDYTYSRLGGDTASTCVANAKNIVAQDLGPLFIYASSTSSLVMFADLATYSAALVAARDACLSLSTTEIDLAQKARRGAVLIDDSKKTSDWADAYKTFDDRYKKALVMTRPQGMIRSFMVSGQNLDRSVFGYIGQVVFDGSGFDQVDLQGALAGYPDSGIF